MHPAHVSLKTLAQLKREHVCFVIESYQRGFRWTRSEVRELLDDVREFDLLQADDEAAQSDKENGENAPQKASFYCLQPIVLSPGAAPRSWNVIDGQQRLVSLYLFYCVYGWLASPGERYNLLPFSLRFTGKAQLQACLELLTENESSASGFLSPEMLSYEDDIDCHYLLEACRCIQDYLLQMMKSSAARRGLERLRVCFDRRVRLIWYELGPCAKEDAAAFFAGLNTGKIELTDSELVKALLLERGKGQRETLRLKIAEDWRKTESELADPRFRCFLSGGRRAEGAFVSPTRMDILLRILALRLNHTLPAEAQRRYPARIPWGVSEEINRDRFAFYVFSMLQKFLRLEQSDEGSEETQSDTAEGRAKPESEERPRENPDVTEQLWETILSGYRLLRSWYDNPRLYHRIGFLTLCAERPAEEILAELAEMADQEGRESNIPEKRILRMIRRELFGAEEISLPDFSEWLTSLQYPKDTLKIRQVLLLYNLACQEALPGVGPFPFELYRREGDDRPNWDLDHIRAVNLGRKLPGCPPEDPDHSIGNLTFLDSVSNRVCGNESFPVKQKIIRKHCSEGLFLPPGTRKVFERDFPGAAVIPAEAGHDSWGEAEKKAYTEDIIHALSSFLKLGDEPYDA